MKRKAARLENAALLLAGLRRCPTCKEVKELAMFSKNKANRNGLSTPCRACAHSYYESIRYDPGRIASKKLATARHKKTEKARLTALEYAKSPNVREQRKRYKQSAKGKASTARYNAKRYKSAAGKAYRKKWLAKNRYLVVAQTIRRRASQKMATPSWVDVEEFVPFYKLAGDLTVRYGKLYDVDHIVPLKGKTVCGLHVPWNLRVIPASMNRSKGNRLIEELCLTP